jgi:protein-S-isoprenylcysteine O-methyltransferase Ste14
VGRAPFRRTSSFSEKESSMEANGSVTKGVSTGLALGATVGVGYAACAGFLLQWPTLVTVVMFPILVFMYARLAKREEADMLAQFGEQYRRYMQSVPAFVPKPGHPSTIKGDFT